MKFSVITSALFLAGYVTAKPMLIPQLFSEGHVSPLYSSAESDILADSYIVVLKDNIDQEKLDQHKSSIAQMAANSNGPFNWLNQDNSSFGIRHVYDLPSLKGYAGKFDAATLQSIRSSDEVAYVEKDSIVYASELQRGAPWGLSRTSSRDKLRLSTFSKYYYDDSAAGEGVKVYVIDTGINIKHVDFEGRAKWGATIPKNDPDEDGNGHGSHCAGTIGGKKFGISKKSIPVAVKVLRSNGSGSTSDVIGGVDWAISSHLKDKSDAEKDKKPYKGAVANMSLGGGASRSLDSAVNYGVESGIVFAVAAGNDNKDACGSSPARAEAPITVGATGIDDSRAYFSNYGKCVDVFAPGLNIQSVWRGSKYAVNTISGTSMASPHVAGLAAYFLSQTENGADPKAIKARILALATKDKLTNVGKDSPNLLIYNGFTESKPSTFEADYGLISKNTFHDNY
ncbi:unnamed protein product [Cunninghamella blakesleeana]